MAKRSYEETLAGTAGDQRGSVSASRKHTIAIQKGNVGVFQFFDMTGEAAFPENGRNPFIEEASVILSREHGDRGGYQGGAKHYGFMPTPN